MASSLKVATMLLLCMLVAKPFAAQAAVTCGTVASSMSKCITYLKGPPSVPPLACCAGVQALYNAASSTRDRQTACTCLKSAATTINGIQLGTAAGLPSACNVNIPYKISPSTNCASVK